MERVGPSGNGRDGWWKWRVCGLLLLATMIMYLDRQTLAQVIPGMTRELGLTNTQYGQLEKGFGLAFAVGAVVLGLVADQVNVRWLYPVVLVGWSIAGLATAWGLEIGRGLVASFPSLAVVGSGEVSTSLEARTAYLGFLVCCVLLGFFEAGHWPCALITTQRLLAPRDRPFGNSLLQSGASLGAILTPLVVLALVTGSPGAWRRPFVLVGLLGTAWVPAWLWLVRGKDLRREEAEPLDARPVGPPSDELRPAGARRFAVLIVVVIAINLTWHFLRAWQPKMLADVYGYGIRSVSLFTSLFYIVSDLGCLASGYLVKRATQLGWRLHRSRVTVFSGCALLTMLTTLAASLPADRSTGALVLLLLVGGGSLGMFPIYYSLSQEISHTRQGLVTGVLSFCTWTVTAYMQEWVGRSIDTTHSYSTGLFWSGLVPLLGVGALALWPRGPRAQRASRCAS